MPHDLFNRYLWLIDTIRRYGRITRADIDELWKRSQFSNGDPLPRRTFCNYRAAAEELFKVEIKCDPVTFEYYIDEDGGEAVTEWLLNAAATHEVISHSRDMADRIFVEDVPSAREFLAPVIDALRNHRRIQFTYQPFYRTVPTTGIVLEPYFVKLFRQRWYVVGRHVEQDRIKTYALDRITGLRLIPGKFKPDPTFDAAAYTANSFGIVVNPTPVRKVAVKVDARLAKYFRALPLHTSQEEYIHDNFSVFHYQLRLSLDLVEELLKYGARVEVLSPPELRSMMADELKRAAAQYEQTPDQPS